MYHLISMLQRPIGVCTSDCTLEQLVLRAQEVWVGGQHVGGVGVIECMASSLHAAAECVAPLVIGRF
jgi:hypothetical protein